MVKVSEGLKKLAKLLDNSLYIVGGYVRNSLLNYPVSDIDLAAKFTPEEVFTRLENSEFTIHYTSEKLMTLCIEYIDERYEYTTFRTDSYSLGHTPDSAKATLDLNIDALRRDFTINAIYFDIANNKIVDPTNGVLDLKNRVISTTRIGEEVFSEDGLRLMRLVRLSAELNFDIEINTLNAAKKFAYKIKEISVERIREELDKILLADTKYGIPYAHIKGMKLLTDIGVMQFILPELTLGIGMPQRKDYHKYDVFNHIINTLKYADKEVRLAALLHDIGKPQCYKKSGKYIGHDIEGERLTEKILSRLKYPKKVIAETKRLVLGHMFDLKMDARENTVRLFVQKNYDILDKLYKLKQADYIGGGICEGVCLSAERLMETYISMVKDGVPFTVKDLKVSGEDLVRLNIPQARRTEALNELLKECALVDTKLTSREKQLKYLEKYIK